jgi:phosphoglycolate phosphatase
LEALGLAPRFAAIVGADSVAKRKPHPDHYRQAVLRAGGMVLHSVMIGDSAADVGAAKAAAAPVAIARFGYSDIPVDRLGADALFSHFNEVPRLVRALIAH